jgi:hypothetical protein
MRSKAFLRLAAAAAALAPAAPVMALLMALSDCGAATPKADEPENADESSSEGTSDKPEKKKDPDAISTDTPSALTGADPMVGVTVKDEPKGQKALPCGGATVPDLAVVLAQAACEVPNDKKDSTQHDVKDQLEITVTTDAPKVAPGATAKVTVVYHNKSKAPLPLDFTADPEPRFDFEVYTVKGTRVDKPAGPQPPLPPEVANAPAPDSSVARVTLAPNGSATLSLSWTAVKSKWASKDKAKGALPGRGYPREPGAPLGKGKYVLRVVTPLVDVFEGVDHEWSQPRTPVEVGSP